MGHRQKMTPSQLLAFDCENYEMAKNSRRGHNHAYMTEELYARLMKENYTQYIFDGGRRAIGWEHKAVEIRNEFRKNGFFAKIISCANRLRIRDYEVWYKPKKTKIK
ncbi:MAG: hypothetical protein UT21_C0006G0009 [Candidatus Woesebacteria bacterium GW2011_GWA1_39_11b]|nr:MAG: hypothetical protein UT21_C0006G0009 [Candidatus Woesebacteria bacterium GW2011_GWA1_39_11b]